MFYQYIVRTVEHGDLISSDQIRLFTWLNKLVFLRRQDDDENFYYTLPSNLFDRGLFISCPKSGF